MAKKQQGSREDVKAQGSKTETLKDDRKAHTDVKVQGEPGDLPKGSAKSDDVLVKCKSKRRPWLGGKPRTEGEEFYLDQYSAKRAVKAGWCEETKL